MPIYRFSIYGIATISGTVEVDAPSEDDAYQMVTDGSWDEEEIEIDCIDNLNDIQFDEIVDGEDEEYPDEYVDSDSSEDEE